MTPALRPGIDGLYQVKSAGLRSTRLHFSHSATFLTFPFSKTVFILTSPPQGQKKWWVALALREFLDTCAISYSLEIPFNI